MAESASSELKFKGGSVHISATHNKKMQTAIVFIEFKTGEKDLLRFMLQKYAAEKRLFSGINMNNGISSNICGETSIVLFVPENKITHNIVLLYAYLAKAHLTSQQCKQCGSGDYKKLTSDIKDFDVTVTGKCKNFIQALKNKATKIENMINQFNNIAPKPRDSFSVDVKKRPGESLSLPDLDTTAMMYLGICCENIPCIITKNKITFLSKNGFERFEEQMLYKDTFQAKVKTFLNQTGSVGSPASNDKGGAKHKDKCKMILQCENVLAKIFSKVRGFNFSFDNVNELKKVNGDAIAQIRTIKVKLE